MRPTAATRTLTARAFAIAAAALAAVCFPRPALAQLDAEIAAARSFIQAERQDVVAKTLGLSDAESAGFWPVYREYRAAMTKVGDRYLEVIKSYAATWESLSDEKAVSLLNEHLAAQQEELKVRKSFLPRFLKVLPARKVARFYQIENKADALLRVDVTEQVPLVP
jgi:hypothetical protein